MALEAEIYTAKNKSFWVYVGNVIGIFSVFSVIGGLGSVQNVSLNNPICGILEWWVTGNYIFLSIAQILGVAGFIMLLIPSARMTGIACWIGIVMLYLVPVEIGHYSSCWPQRNLEGGTVSQNAPVETSKEVTAEELLSFPEKPLRTP